MLKSTDSEYLETLSDEEFFAKRFTMSETDQEELLKNSVLIDGHRFYKASVKERLFQKYAAETNPKPGEPGSKENPLIRYGKEYVYNEYGDLVEYIRHNVKYVLRSDMKPTAAQKRMIIAASLAPIRYSEDCPELSEQKLKGFVQYGLERNQRRAACLKDGL